MTSIQNNGNEPESAPRTFLAFLDKWLHKIGHGGERIAASSARAGGIVLRFGAIVLLVYAVGMFIFAIFNYSTTKSTLLSYGLSNATGTLIAWAVMFIAIGIPVGAILRIFIFRGRPYDYAAAMILPLISWGMAQIPANFDAKTGQALKYCSNRPDNSLFCLDYPGIDPLTQKKLVPINPNLAELEFRKDRGLAPKRIAQPVANMVFFDPLTAQPKVWVHKNDQGCFDLFDNPGADPQSGDPLAPITKEAVRVIKECANKALREQERVQAATAQASTEVRGNGQQQKPGNARLSLAVPANGYSDHVMPPVGYATTFYGHGYTIHCVYSDGSEGVVGHATRPCKDGDMLYQYVRDTTGQPNSVTYEFVRFR